MPKNEALDELVDDIFDRIEGFIMVHASELDVKHEIREGFIHWLNKPAD